MLLTDTKILSNLRIKTIKSTSQIYKPPQEALHSLPLLLTHTPHKRKMSLFPIWAFRQINHLCVQQAYLLTNFRISSLGMRQVRKDSACPKEMSAYSLPE